MDGFVSTFVSLIFVYEVCVHSECPSMLKKKKNLPAHENQTNMKNISWIPNLVKTDFVQLKKGHAFIDPQKSIPHLRTTLLMTE